MGVNVNEGDQMNNLNSDVNNSSNQRVDFGCSQQDGMDRNGRKFLKHLASEYNKKQIILRDELQAYEGCVDDLNSELLAIKWEFQSKPFFIKPFIYLEYSRKRNTAKQIQRGIINKYGQQITQKKLELHDIVESAVEHCLIPAFNDQNTSTEQDESANLMQSLYGLIRLKHLLGNALRSIVDAQPSSSLTGVAQSLDMMAPQRGTSISSVFSTKGAHDDIEKVLSEFGACNDFIVQFNAEFKCLKFREISDKISTLFTDTQEAIASSLLEFKPNEPSGLELCSKKLTEALRKIELVSEELSTCIEETRILYRNARFSLVQKHIEALNDALLPFTSTCKVTPSEKMINQAFMNVYIGKVAKRERLIRLTSIQVVSIDDYQSNPHQ
ncbi:hypothetical protein GCM10007932_03910 [Vibrio penaeicida]|uniref:DUF3150 domain-containing protein n=2 Tax=Vibrio penaeicida TaxID=104609 RepID=A0AAV5NK83_9VIBR|nr:hypothetical protein GCM10007932_03910 [Vibrio penaeicida]